MGFWIITKSGPVKAIRDPSTGNPTYKNAREHSVDGCLYSSKKDAQKIWKSSNMLSV